MYRLFAHKLRSILECMPLKDQGSEKFLLSNFSFLSPNLDSSDPPPTPSNLLTFSLIENLLKMFESVCESSDLKLKKVVSQSLQIIYDYLLAVTASSCKLQTLKTRNELIFSCFNISLKTDSDVDLSWNQIYTETIDKTIESKKSLQNRILICKLIRRDPQKITSQNWGQALYCLYSNYERFEGDELELIKSQLHSLFHENCKVVGKEFAKMCQGFTQTLPSITTQQQIHILSLVLQMFKAQLNSIEEFWKDFQDLMSCEFTSSARVFGEFYSWTRKDPLAIENKVIQRQYDMLGDIGLSNNLKSTSAIVNVLEEIIASFGLEFDEKEWEGFFHVLEIVIATLGPTGDTSIEYSRISSKEFKKLNIQIFDLINLVKMNFLPLLTSQLIERYLEVIKLMTRLTTNESHRHGLLEFIIMVASAIAKLPNNSSLWIRCLYPVKDALFPIQSETSGTALGVLQAIVSDNSNSLSEESWKFIFDEMLFLAMDDIIEDYFVQLAENKKMNSPPVEKAIELTKIGITTTSRVMTFSSRTNFSKVPINKAIRILLKILEIPAMQVTSEVPKFLKATLDLKISDEVLCEVLRALSIWVWKQFPKGQALLEVMDILWFIVFESNFQQNLTDFFPDCLELASSLFYAQATDVSAFTAQISSRIKMFFKSTIRLVYFSGSNHLLFEKFTEMIPNLFWSKISCLKTNRLAIQCLEIFFEELDKNETRLSQNLLSSTLVAFSRVMDLATNAHYHSIITDEGSFIYIAFIKHLKCLSDTLAKAKAFEHLGIIARVFQKTFVTFCSDGFCQADHLLLILDKESEVLKLIFSSYAQNLVLINSSKEHIRQFISLVFELILIIPKLDSIENKRGTELVVKLLESIEDSLNSSDSISAAYAIMFIKSTLVCLCNEQISGSFKTFLGYSQIFNLIVGLLTFFKINEDINKQLETLCKLESIFFKTQVKNKHLSLIVREVSTLAPLVGGHSQILGSFFALIASDLIEYHTLDKSISPRTSTKSEIGSYQKEIENDIKETPTNSENLSTE